MSEVEKFMKKYPNESGDIETLKNELLKIETMDISEVKKIDLRQVKIEEFKDNCDEEDYHDVFDEETDTFHKQIIEGWGMGQTLNY